ncbi:MAG TPA: hypothetical protein VMU15_15185 [Anaeromyxobacter sp.]|nr:hypothetical protein [Anaeromyxobacter sp.]
MKLWLTALAALACGACAPRDREVRLARIRSEAGALEERLEALQARLLADQARVRYWEERRGPQGSPPYRADLEARTVATGRRTLPEDARPNPAERTRARRLRVAAQRADTAAAGW